MLLDLKLRPFGLGTEPAMKRCTGCATDRPLESFRRSKVGRMGTTARCRTCLAAKDKADRAAGWRREAERKRDRSPHRQAYFRIKDHKRRAAVSGAEVSAFTDADLFSHWDDAGYYVCYWCDLPFTDDDPLHRDHLVPLALGGPHALTNLVPAHQSCNTSKGAKDPFDFARELHPWLT